MPKNFQKYAKNFQTISTEIPKNFHKMAKIIQKYANIFKKF